MAEPAKKILLVEDEILIALAEAEMLKANGFDVSLAGSGEEAVRISTEGQHIDLILMDIDLGKGMDGTQAASKILLHHDIPILFLSSHIEPEIVNKTEEISSYGYVAKNSGETILLASIKMAFRLNKAYTTINMQNQDIAQSNEELQATIEELTATNEEFEVQNEELISSQQEIMARDRTLREREQYLSQIINNTQFGAHFYRLDESNNLVFTGANQAACKILGTDQSRYTGKTIEEVVPGLVETDIPALCKQCALTGESFSRDNVIYQEGEITAAYEISAFGTTGKNMAVFFTDITYRKKMESTLKKSEENLRSIFENAAVGIAFVSPEGQFLKMNTAFCTIIGYSQNESTSLTFQMITHPDDLHYDMEQLEKMRRREIDGFSLTKRYIKKDKSVVWIYVTVNAIRHSDGNIENFVSVVEDITERLSMESELASHQRLIERAQRIINIGYWIFDLRNKTFFASKETCSIYGLGNGEWNIRETQNIPLPQYREMLDSSLKNLIENREPYDVTFKIKRKNDGAIIDIHSIAEYDVPQNKVFGIIQDITDQKQTEEARRISEERYRKISEVILDYIYTVNIQNGKAINTVHAPGCINVTGYTSEDFTRDPYLWFTMVYYEDRPFVEEMARQALLEKKIEPYEHRIIRKDKSMRWVKNTTLPHYNSDGVLTSIDGLIEDITERKNMEEALRESETKYRQLIENLNDIVWSTDADLRFNYISSIFKKISGFTEEEILGRHVWEFMKSEFKEMARSSVTNRLRMINENKQVGAATYVTEMKCKDGRYIWVEITSSPVLDKNGVLLGFQGITRDITYKKEAEEALTYSNAYIKSLFDSVNDAIFVHDGKTGKIIDANKRTLEMYGFTYEEIITSDPNQFSLGTSPFSLKEIYEWLEKAKSEGLQNFEWIARRKDKTVFWADISILYTKIGHDEKFVATVRDISERKHAENLIRQSESLLKESQRVAHLGHYIFDVATGFWSNSETLDNIFGIQQTYKKNELGWKNIIHPYKKDIFGWENIIHPDDREMMSVYLREYVIKQHNQFDKEYRIIRINDQKVRWVHGLGNLSFDKNVNVIEMFGTIQDITDKKEVELALASAVKEKEELLRELNHRVKNSLSMITGLVGLEKNQTQNSELKKSLETLRNRIITISNLYTMFDSRQQETDMRLDIYLRTISESIHASYASDNKKITIATDMNNSRIDVKRAATVGLILNELLTNVYKYAFPEKGGTVRISLSDDKDNYSLSVIDNGIGLPENFDLHGKTGIGMKLIHLLAQQMNGTVLCSSKDQTEFTVTFPKIQ
jgi:PAS domain S-box-containing protein